MDHLLEFYAPSTADEGTVASGLATASTASVATENAASSASHPLPDTNLVNDSPYTLADHLLQHQAVLV
jgi:hypothetical protein